MDKLKQIKLLGQGAFGKCYLCENPDDNSQWVVKQIDISNMSAQEKKEAYHEAKVMSAFDHPNIIKFINVYPTTNGKLNIVMNYADGGDLSSKIKQQRGKLFTENEILDMFVQISLAIKHVHDRKVLHRDIKAQNVFLMKSGLIKLGDFGISKVLSNTIDKARTMVGTPYYLSPEIVENRPYSFKSDVWSLGVLLYELCTLKPPFDGASIRHLGLNIVRGIYPPIPPHFSRDLKTLIAQMLTVDSNRRPTVTQVLRMPFIKSRIQNLLSESKRFEEFSHTILHKKQLFDAKGEIKKEPPKIEPKKEPPKIEAKKETPRNEPKKEPPKPEMKREPPKELPAPVKDIHEKINNFTPKQKIEVKETPKKLVEVRENKKIYEPAEIPKFNEPKEVKKLMDAREVKIIEKEYVKPPPKPVYKPPAAFGKLEDVFKPVEKNANKKNDAALAQAREEAKKKKEIEAKKKLEEILQKRENSKNEMMAKQEAAEKKKNEKIQKIKEEREKMLNDIKMKKNLRNASQPLVQWPEGEGVIEKPVVEAKSKPQYAEQRKKMLEEARKKARQNKKDFQIEWVGLPDFGQMIEKIEAKDDFELDYSKLSSDSSSSELSVLPIKHSNSQFENPPTANLPEKSSKFAPKASQDSLMFSEVSESTFQVSEDSQNAHELEHCEEKSPEELRMIEMLKQAIAEDTASDEEIYITQVPEEDVVDRIDEIADKEVIQIAKEEIRQQEEEVGSTYNSLEAMRDFLEAKMGMKMLIEAYNVIKDMGDIDPIESGYSEFYSKLGNIVPIDKMEEYVSYLRTLIILENHADSYLDGIVNKKY